MDKSSAGDVLDRLHQVFGVKNDNQLSQASGVHRATVGNWRSRNSVPYSFCIDVAKPRGISLDWLLTGEGPMRRDEEWTAAPAPSLTPQEEALLTLFRELGETDQREILSAAEEKKRLSAIEQRLQEMEAALAAVQRSA